TPVDRFDFEELPDAEPIRNHERYLWGNPGEVCAFVLADAFQRAGWDCLPGKGHEVDGLPQHVYRDQDESRIMPCAEVWLTDRAATAILTKGFIAVLSIQGRDAIKLPALASLALPLRLVAGRWS